MEDAKYLKKTIEPEEPNEEPKVEDLELGHIEAPRKKTPEELHEIRMKNLQMWEPGVSGNPSGRPKGAKTKALVAKKWLEMAEESVNEITGVSETLTQEDLITLAMIKRAKKGDVKAYKELLNAAFGDEKNINHSGNIGLANITGMEII